MDGYLLDVNALLALMDPRHVHRGPVRRWFIREGSKGWATCPTTENDLVRITSHPSYPNRPGDTSTVLAILRQFCAAPEHAFWPDSFSIRDAIVPAAVVSHSHLTDVYLLGLAAQMGGQLATMDGNIPVSAIQGGAGAIEIISAGNSIRPTTRA